MGRHRKQRPALVARIGINVDPEDVELNNATMHGIRIDTVCEVVDGEPKPVSVFHPVEMEDKSDNER